MQRGNGDRPHFAGRDYCEVRAPAESSTHIAASTRRRAEYGASGAHPAFVTVFDSLLYVFVRPGCLPRVPVSLCAIRSFQHVRRDFSTTAALRLIQLQKRNSICPDQATERPRCRCNFGLDIRWWRGGVDRHAGRPGGAFASLLCSPCVWRSVVLLACKQGQR